MVGAGIAGLTAAYGLQLSGHEVEVLEASARPGGRMASARVSGLPVDLGAHVLLDSFDRTRALAEEVGLGGEWFELQGGDEGGVLHGDEVTSFSPRSAFDVLRYRGLSLTGRLRFLLALLHVKRRHSDLDFFDLSAGDGSLDDEDCETYARRHLGDEAADYVVDSFIRTFHFHGARRMSARYFEALAALLVQRGQFRLCALRGGMQSLPAALAARLTVRYDQAVTSVVPAGGAVRVIASGAERTHDAVVVATTAERARALLTTPTPEHEALLGGAASSCTALCVYGVPREILGDFAGIWVPFLESRVVSGVSNDAGKGGSDGARTALSVWLHEETAATWLGLPDAELARRTAEEVGRLFPRYAGHLEPLLVQRWPEALPVYGAGHVARASAFWAGGQGQQGIWLCGDYLNHPWVEGAVRCGEKVAMRLSDRVDSP